MKKIICILFAVIMCFATIGMSASAQSSIIYGDANYDKNFNIRDLIRLEKYCSDHENIQINVMAVDSDCNGVIDDASDLVVMKKALLGVITYEDYIYNNGFFDKSW